MPTPRERANAVVHDWIDGTGLPIATDSLDSLASMIEGAIDAQVADWLASLPATTFRPELVAKASHVVASEAGKDYSHVHVGRPPPIPTGAILPGQAVYVPGPNVEDEPEPCPHEVTRWNDHNTRLVCRDCKTEFKPGVCIRCNAPAVNEDSFSCGRPCRG